MYTRGRKHLQPLRGWNRKLVRVLHGKAGGATDRAINFVLLHRAGGGDRDSGVKNMGVSDVEWMS